MLKFIIRDMLHKCCSPVALVCGILSTLNYGNYLVFFLDLKTHFILYSIYVV